MIFNRITLSTSLLAAISAISATSLLASPTSPSQPDQLTEAQIDSLERAAYGNARNLQELVVSADAPMIKVAANQITYNVEDDPSSSGSTVLDLLRKVPMVSVDGQDNIQVKGNGDFKIYVNGRPDPALSQNASVVLKSMPAESVASIELITEPGAKYDAEGSGAIINLVTMRKRRETGYNGAVNLSVDNRNLQTGLNGAMKINRLNLNAGVNYAHGWKDARKAKISDRTLYLNNDNEHSLVERGFNSQNIDFVGIDLGGSYDLSSSDLLTFSANYYDVFGDVRTTDQTTEMYSADQTLQWSYSRNSDLHMKYRGVTTQAAYQHEFGRADNYLGVSYMFSFSNVGLPGVYTYGDLNNYRPAFLYQRNSNSRIAREHTAQIDWADRLNPHAKIEVGAKGIFRHNSAFGLTETSNDLLLFAPLADTEVNLRQPQNIYALYAQYTANYGNFTGQAGLRYEHTRMGIRYPEESTNDFTSTLNDVVPNASLTYSFSPAHSLTASYSMRISRPSIEQLNPYPLELSNTRIQQGNPDLTSERINKVSITYNNFGRALGGSITADYTDSHNAISAYGYLDGIRMIQTYANIGHNRTAALNLFLMWSATNNLRFSLNAGGNYTDLKASGELARQTYSNHGFSGNLNLNVTWNLPEKFELGAFGGCSSGSFSLMGKSGDYHYYGLNLSRTFLKDDSLKLTLNAMNCFEKYTTFKNTIASTDFITTNSWANPSWTVGVSATWNFGKNQAGVKNVNSSIINDDISNAKSSTGVN
ncbi:MAG: TonB-dependent receptor [Bacteroides sp.]|nr:TonB-dependent receptor [Bacteroides sp.]